MVSSTDPTSQARRFRPWWAAIATAIAALVVGPLLGGLALGAPATTFSDGTFNNADWTAPPDYKFFDATPGASGTFTAFQVATGGSPLVPSYGTDAYRRVTHDFDGPGTVIFGHLKFAAIYDPATQGAIQHVDFAFDINVFDPGASRAVGYTGLIRQNGSFYIKTPVVADAINQWLHFDVPGLTAADFAKFGSFGTGGPTPDFSASGAPIQFGFATTNGSCCPGHVHTDSGIDNWAVFVTSVPVNSTTTGVSCTPSSVIVGTSTTCAATVSDLTTPTGMVTFASDSAGTFSSTSCNLSGSGSSASCSVTYTPTAVGTGTHTIHATYAGDSGHTSSSGSTTVMVNPRPTTTVVNCSPNSFQAGGTTTCMATVSDAAGGAATAPTATVIFSTSDTSSGTFVGSPCALTPINSSQSHCSVTYSDTKAGAVNITATYPGDATHSGSTGVTQVTVTAGPPAQVTLAPTTQTQTVDTQACVTATVTDAFGNPTPNIVVQFSVTGVNTASSSGTTNGTGQTTFCYVGRLFGADTVKATASATATGVATVTWVLPVTTPLCAVDITNGGWIIANNGDKSSFGGNASSDEAGNPSGQEQYTDSPANLDVHSINVQAIVCSNNMENAEIFGQATINGSGQHAYRIDVSDPDSAGGSDTYWILLDTGYDSGVHPLGGGNIEFHKT